ncbi:AMP-binding enzyme [Aspergillus transmontanensis]|uniref:AMP-binding enzyme n=1 Tax=Aspergillus transmontanensis TaxID=1034304 RepID=A0A5N6VDH9_9EURO|nr:AMP-binding enzyme [Aspergillus transmontanensis]
MAQTIALPLPGIEHGKRILASVVETRARDGPESTWVSVPIDNEDLSRGFEDISFQQLNNAANHAARWLSEHLPGTSEPFQCFAYAGPKDFRYPILAVAAAKIQKVMVLPSPLVTAEAQLRILENKRCTVYLRPSSMASQVDAILREAPHIQTVDVPEIDEFIREDEAVPYIYGKTWEEGKDDPWLVFHTSGTTGYPKPVTYTHSMMAFPDIAASLPDVELGYIHQYAYRRWYTPVPSLHFLGTVMTLAIPTFLHMTTVVGPPVPPSAEIITKTLQYGQVEGAILPPALIDVLCQTSSGLDALRQLKFVHYAGAPLSKETGDQLASHVRIVPCIGSTEAGGYFTLIHDHRDAWDYTSFQEYAGAVFENRLSNLYELVFIRRPGDSPQPVFKLYPDLDRFETKDLWIEHPVHKGLWKIIGRTDDYVYLSHADGLHASLLEPEIEAHPRVRSALIGGHGRPAPVIIVELFSTEEGETQEELISSLQPYIEKVNARVHDCVRLSTERVIIAAEEKPFIRTIKGSVARMQTLGLYEDEIAALFS